MEQILTWLSYPVFFVVALTVLVFVHELGHYLVARWCGVRIETFSIGMGRELFGRTDRHGTRWRVAMLPIGGYVKMFGDADAGGRPAPGVVEGEEDGVEAKRALTPEERAVSVHHKKLWQRALIVAAGPFANLLFAVLALTLLFMVSGQSNAPSEIGSIRADGPAARAGLLPGDRIVALDGRPVRRFDDVLQTVMLHLEGPLAVTYRRDGQEATVSVIPERQPVACARDAEGNTLRDASGEIRRDLCRSEIGDIGIGAPLADAVVGEVMRGFPAEAAGIRPGDRVVAIDGVPVASFEEIIARVSPAAGRELVVELERDGQARRVSVTPRPGAATNADGSERQGGLIGLRPRPWPPERLGPLEALHEGLTGTVTATARMLRALGQILDGTRAAKEIGGVVTIAEVSGDMGRAGVEAFVSFLVMLSISLAIMNLLPIPPLDGGHLMFYAFEAVRGRPLGQRAQAVGFQIGLALVLSFAVFALWNDISAKLAPLTSF